MLRLNLLGAVDLVDGDGRSRNGDVGGTKPLALLVYLALESARGPVRRDRAAAMLWPESTQKNARQSLSQALYALKSGVGDVVSVNGQEELGIDTTRISVDGFEFEEHARAGRLEDAVALYRGDVATGLYVKDAPDFDAWLSRQQTTWRGNMAAVLVKLFEAAVQSGELKAAAAWAEQLLDVAPENGEPMRTLLPLLVARRERPLAARLYAHWKLVLDECFGDEPPEELQSLIENLPQARRSADAPLSALHIAQPARMRRGSLMWAAVAVLVLVGSVTGGAVVYRSFQSRGSLAAYDGSAPRIAVLPFASAGAAQRQASVLNEALQWRLSNVGFQVLNAFSPDTAALRKLVGRDGRRGMTFVLGGDVATEADSSIAARVWLKDAGSGKRIWESRFTQSATAAHLIPTELSTAVTTQIRRVTGNAIELAAGSERVSAESWRDVYRARERMEAALAMRWQEAAAGAATELKDAELALAQVTEREPHWALPWVLRARIAEWRAFNPLISADPRQGAAELDRAIRMLDSVATRLDSEALYEARGALETRRFILGVDDVAAANRLLTRAEADLRKAAAPGRDPSGSYAALSAVMFMQGKYAEAFVYARRAYDSNVFLRNNEEVLVRLFNSALHAGDDASADYWCKELQKTLPGQWPGVLCRIHLAGFAPHMVGVATLEQEIDDMAGAPPVREAMTPRLRAAYAITLAQLGRADSARATLAALPASKDPEVMLFRAFALAALQDAPQAHAALRDYLAEYRGTRSMALHMRWLRQGQTHMPLTR